MGTVAILAQGEGWMTSNTLRGGKNVYTSAVLCGNWFEQKFEPVEMSRAKENEHQLPAPNARGWTSTMGEMAGDAAPGFAPKITNATGEIYSYQDVPSDVRFSTAYKRDYVSCNEQVPPFKAPSMPEDKVKAYRDMWTGGEPWQFNR